MRARRSSTVWDLPPLSQHALSGSTLLAAQLNSPLQPCSGHQESAVDPDLLAEVRAFESVSIALRRAVAKETMRAACTCVSHDHTASRLSVRRTNEDLLATFDVVSAPLVDRGHILPRRPCRLATLTTCPRPKP